MPMESSQPSLTTNLPSLDRVLFRIQETPVTVATIGLAILIIALTWLSSRLLRGLIQRGLELRGVSAPGTIAAARRLTHYTVTLIGTLVTLRTLGIDLTTLFAAGAVFALGISFALQNIVQNFVSGVILLVERTIKPGDVLEVEGKFMRVRRMGIRTTVAQTLDDEEIIVPNATIVQSTVKNYTLADSLHRLRAVVGVAYNSDMELVKRVLEDTARAATWRVANREPLVNLLEFGNSAVIWEVSVWIDDPWRQRRARSALNEAIWSAFRENDITIAFPQLDVHFDQPLARLLGALSPAR